MQLRQKLLTASALIFTTLLLSNCTKPPEPVTSVEVRTVNVRPPKPIVSEPDQLQLRKVDWIVVTSENIDEVFLNIKGEKVLFALTTEGYENISLNLSDVRSLIEQQKVIIATYRNSFE